MTDAPERIWAYAWTGQTRAGQWHINNAFGRIEYVRADLYTALQARLAEVEAERDCGYRLLGNADRRAEAAEAALATARAQRLEALNCNAWQAQRIAQLEAIIKETAK